MKRVLLISLAAAFCVAACGEKTHLQLKARDMKEAQQKAGTGTAKPTDPSGSPGEDGVLNMPTNTNNRKVPMNGSATRNVIIGSDSMTTTVFCSANLAKAQKEKERIKIQGKSQIILRQVVTMAIPEAPTDGKSKTETAAPKTLVSIACLGDSADLTKEPQDEDVTPIKLLVGKSATIAGKFSSVATDIESKAIVSCVTAKDMAKANSILLPEDKSTASDILMAGNSKLLVETNSKDKDLKKYLLVTCEDPTPAAPATPPAEPKKDVATESDVQE